MLFTPKPNTQTQTEITTPRRQSANTKQPPQKRSGVSA